MKAHLTTSLRVTVSGKKVKAAQTGVLFVERQRKIQEWNEQKLPKELPGYSGGTLPGRSVEERGRAEEEEEKDSRERHVKFEIVQKVVEDIDKKASAHEDAKSTAQRTARQSVKQS